MKVGGHMLCPGIYEQLVDRRLARELDQLPENQKATAALDKAESSSVLSQYLADIVHKALERMCDGKSELSDQVALVNQLIAMASEAADEDIDEISVDERAQQLLALLSEKDPPLHWASLQRMPYARRPLWHKAVYLPAQCMNHRCSQN